MKISILGYSGAGKSTFAKKLHKHLNIPLVYLDAVYFKENWVPREDMEIEADIQSFMKQEDWIIEGNYRKYAPNRFSDADKIYILKLNRFICLYHVILRRFQYRNRPRESSAKGCNEKLDFSFFMWVILTGRTKKRRAFHKNIENMYKEKVTIFKTTRQIHKFLQENGIKNG